MTVSIQQVRNRLGTDLSDALIQLMIDGETEALEREHGASAASETHLAKGIKRLVLKRKPATISAVKERIDILDSEVTLSANDYRQLGQRILLRLGDGDNPADHWGEEVVVTYTAEVDTALRDRVILDLVQLAAEFGAYQSEEAGDWQGDQSDYHERRSKLLAQIREPSMPLL